MRVEDTDTERTFGIWWSKRLNYLEESNCNTIFRITNSTKRKCEQIAFSPTGFHWIQRMQWIMTKPKIGLVTKGSTCLATITLPVAVVRRASPILPIVWCPILLATLIRYQTRDSNGNSFLLLDEIICCGIWTVSGNHTTFGLSQDSLNWMNSAKAI